MDAFHIGVEEAWNLTLTQINHAYEYLEARDKRREDQQQQARLRRR